MREFHEQARAFTDGKARAVGSTGDVHPRGAMSLVNVAYASALTWGDPTKTRLEDQALVPMFGEQPVELGLEQPGTAMLGRLRNVDLYRRLFPDAFPGEPDAFTVPNVTRALASFERTIISGRSSYDRYHYDRDEAAISPAARRGEQLFFSQPLSCFRCHNGFNFSGATDFEGRQEGRMPEYHNTGLYNLAGLLSYPSPNTGMYEVTHRREDVGKFKAPTLRNIAVTAPYMHDGSIATLDEVLDHYAAGGRTIAEGPNRGMGHDNPNKSPIVKGFPFTAEQKVELVAFLNALTDNDLLNDTQFANPWNCPASGGPMTTLSARNHLAGTIDEIVWGDVLVHVTVRVGDAIIESVITRRSAEEMGLKKGDNVTAVVKATGDAREVIDYSRFEPI